jgi:ERCC4-type nuclease
MTTEAIKIICDTREPWPHPWARWLPSHVQIERATLETGDFALAGLPDGAVVERKTVSDFHGCVTSNRERFERELARSRYVGRFVVVVEGSLFDCIDGSGGPSEASLIGTVAAWSRRFCPIIFAGDERHAAVLAWRYLAGQITEGHRIIRAAERETAGVATAEGHLAIASKKNVPLPVHRACF